MKDILINEELTTPLPEDCKDVMILGPSELREIWRDAVRITDTAGPPEDSSYIDGENKYVKANAIGLIGEHHYENHYQFSRKETTVNPAPDKGIDYIARYTPTGEEFKISINCRNRWEADLPVRDWRAKCDVYFLYETNFLNDGPFALVGVVGGATHKMVENAPLAHFMPKRHKQYPHLVKREDLFSLPGPDELEPL